MESRGNRKLKAENFNLMSYLQVQALHRHSRILPEEKHKNMYVLQFRGLCEMSSRGCFQRCQVIKEMVENGPGVLSSLSFLSDSPILSRRMLSAPFPNFEPHRVSSRRFFKLRSRDPADCRVILASPRRRLQVTRRLEAVRGPCSTAKL